MDREERLRRRREQYRARRNRKCRRERLEARRAHEGCRCAMMSTEQQQMLLQWRREARHRTELIPENQPLEIPSVDDPFVVSKVT